MRITSASGLRAAAINFRAEPRPPRYNYGINYNRAVHRPFSLISPSFFLLSALIDERVRARGIVILDGRVRISLTNGMEPTRVGRNEIYVNVFIHRNWRYPLRDCEIVTAVLAIPEVMPVVYVCILRDSRSDSVISARAGNAPGNLAS